MSITLFYPTALLYALIELSLVKIIPIGKKKKKKKNQGKEYVDEIEWNYTGEKNRGTIVHVNKKEHAGW